MRLPEISQQNMTCPLPWQPYSSQTTTNVPVNISVHPASLAKHPRQWTKEEVGVWLRWCTEEFSIEAINPDKFDLNGKALCLLSRSDFIERLPKNGDVLYNCLQSLINKSSGGGVLYQPNFSFGATSIVETTQLQKEPVTSLPSLPRGLIFVPSASTCPSTLSYSHSAVPTRSYVPIKPYPTTHGTVSRVPSPIKTTTVSNTPGFGENEEKPVVQQDFDKNLNDKEGPSSFKDFLRYPFQSVSEAASPSFTDHKLDIPRHQRSSDCRLLWEFIYQLLMNTKYSNFVSWENREEYVFRIVNPTGLAELWGQQKNRTNMTYEKLSRALRYYYRMNIIKKVQGKRLTYKFLQPPSCIQKGQRGAKPHGRVQVTYEEVLPSHHDPSLSDVRCPDYDSDANSLTDHSMDGFEEDQKDTDSDLSFRDQGHRLQANPSCIKGSDSPNASMGEHNFSESRNQRVDLDSYHMDLCRLQNDRIPAANPFHLTSSVFDTYPMKFNLHYRGTEHSTYPTVYKPSPTYPVLGCNNRLGPSHSIVKDERFEFGIVPPAHSNSPVHKAQSSHENLKRSLSYDLSTLQVPKFQLRPNQARSASPRKDLQLEPEDLTVKKISVLHDINRFVKTEIDDREEEKTNDVQETCDHSEQDKMVDEKPPT